MESCLASQSVADPGCLSPDPGSWFLPIPDPGSRIQNQQQKSGVKKNLLPYLFLEPQISQIENYFIFEMLKKKFGPIFKEL